MKKPTKGTELPSGKRQIAIQLDQDLFDSLSREAEFTKIAFSALVRFYLKLGMGRRPGGEL